MRKILTDLILMLALSVLLMTSAAGQSGTYDREPQNNDPEDYLGSEIDNMDIGGTANEILSEQNSGGVTGNDKPGYGYGYRPGYGKGWGYGYDYLD